MAIEESKKKQCILLSERCLSERMFVIGLHLCGILGGVKLRESRDSKKIIITRVKGKKRGVRKQSIYDC